MNRWGNKERTKWNVQEGYGIATTRQKKDRKIDGKVDKRKQNCNAKVCGISRLVDLVVSMSDYWSWGRGFDPRYFHKF